MKANREQLINAFDKVQHAIAAKDTIPIFKRLYVAEDQLFAFNGTSGVMATCDLGAMKFDVDGALFGRLIRALDGKDIDLTPSKGHLTVKSGGHTSRLGQINEDAPFPEEKRPKMDKCPSGFVEALKRCVTFTAPNDTRAFMAAVFVQGEYFYATDGSSGGR